MEEPSDRFLGAFKHGSLCNPEFYGERVQSLLLTMFCIVCASNKATGYSGVTWNGYLCTLLILAVDKCHLTLNHLFIEVLIVVDWFMTVSIAPSPNVL